MSGGKATASSPSAMTREAAALSMGEMMIAGAESVLSLEVRVAKGQYKAARLVEREGQRAVWQVGDAEVRVFFACGALSGKRGRLEEASDVWGKAAKEAKKEEGDIASSPAPPAAPAPPAPVAEDQRVEVPVNAPEAWAAGTVRLGPDGSLTSAKITMKEGERTFKCEQCGKGFVNPTPQLHRSSLSLSFSLSLALSALSLAGSHLALSLLLCLSTLSLWRQVRDSAGLAEAHAGAHQRAALRLRHVRQVPFER